MTDNIDYRLTELWRLPRVITHVGLGKTKIYALMRCGEFPKPIELTKRARAWRASDVVSWAIKRGFGDS
jgi:prophage regulatory protein